MRTIRDAREVAVAQLAEFADLDPVLLDEQTEEFESGWVFFYQSARFLETQRAEDGLVGNAPLFVPRSDAEAQFISYHRAPSDSAEAFSICGDANAPPKAEVDLLGWHEGARKVSATKAIRDHSSLGLAAAHAAIERCLLGEHVHVPALSVAAAKELAVLLNSLGFSARVAHGA